MLLLALLLILAGVEALILHVLEAPTWVYFVALSFMFATWAVTFILSAKEARHAD